MDPLDRFNELVACPVCASFDRAGASRCVECGTFHSQVHAEDRAPPPPSARPLPEPIDPTRYSLDPNASIQTVNDDAEVEDVTKQWSGGSTDFSFEEE